MTVTNQTSMKITYKRGVYPETITGLKADYWIVVDGQRVGFIRVDRAGRSSGTWTHWSAYRLDGTRIGYDRLLSRLKADVIQPYFWRHNPTGDSAHRTNAGTAVLVDVSATVHPSGETDDPRVHDDR